MKSLIPKAKESEIQKCILEGLAAKRIFAFRLNTAAMKVGDRFFRAHSLGKGAADILAFPGMSPLWIECKTAAGKISNEQSTFGEFVKTQGHYYLVARSWDEVSEYLRGIWGI